MLKRVIDFYNDLNMKYKLFITFLFLISIPFLIFTIINNSMTSRDLENQALYSSRQVFEQGRSYMEYKIDSIKTYMTVVSMNEKIQEVIKKDPKEYDDNLGLWGFDINQIRMQFLNSNPSMDIEQTCLYLNDSLTSIDETTDLQRMSGILETDWYKKLESGNNTYVWFYDGKMTAEDGTEAKKYISAARRIPNNENMGEIIGLVRVDMSESVFTTLLDHVAYFKSSSVFLINSTDEAICTSTSTEVTDTSFSPGIIKKYSAYSLKSGCWDKFKINNKNYLIGIQAVKGTDWNLVITIPYNEILASESKTRKQMLLIILLISPLALPLAFWGASSGTKRISKLINHMRSIQKGDFNVSILSSSKDEIGELTRNFNSMVTRISMLLDEKYALGQEIKSIELKALQAQINPHFLYNTLDLIYWRAVRIKENSISTLVQSLSKFYKLSLSKGNDIVALENEIEHVKAYVQIQNERFKNGISLIIEIPESLFQYRIPKITLQPIVENSIIHGILETKDERGTIKITGYTSSATIVLEVADNGVGMTPEKLATILDASSNDTLHGYGIHNINKRIKLLYGEEYGLIFDSKQGFGTTVRIILPG